MGCCFVCYVWQLSHFTMDYGHGDPMQLQAVFGTKCDLHHAVANVLRLEYALFVLCQGQWRHIVCSVTYMSKSARSPKKVEMPL